MANSDLLCANNESERDIISKWLDEASDPDEFFDVFVDSDCGNFLVTSEIHNADTVVDQEVFKGWSQVPGEEWCTLTFRNGDYFEGFCDMEDLSNREGVLVRLSDHGAVTSAKWLGDALEGLVVIESSLKDGWTKGYYSKGRPNGIIRKFGPSIKERREDNLRMVAFYESGSAVGTAWKRLVGGGYLVGSLDDDEKVSGKRCAYLYPDLSTAIIGRFESDRFPY